MTVKSPVAPGRGPSASLPGAPEVRPEQLLRYSILVSAGVGQHLLGSDPLQQVDNAAAELAQQQTRLLED